MNLLPAYEIWTWIKGYEGRFEVSNRGRVRSWVKQGGTLKTKGTIKCTCNPFILKSQKHWAGYSHLHIGNKSRKDIRLLRIHREVAKVYCINSDIKYKTEVNHLNGIKACNEWWNLQWDTRNENIDHAFRTGLIKPALGEQQSNTKLTNNQVLEIYASFRKIVHLAKEYHMSVHAISDIKNGRTWWHLTGHPRHIRPSEYGRFKKAS